MREKGILATLFLGAFCIRLVGLDWGYFHGDERINDAARVLSGDLVPGQHFYPPLFNYINAVGLAGLFVVGRIADWWSGVSGFRDAYFTDPTPFYLTARMVTAAFGAMVAPLFYCLARTLKQPILAATVIAILGGLIPASVSFSYIAKGDTPLAAAALLTVLFFAQKVITPDRPSKDLWLGFAACFALSFKQSIVFLLVPLLVVHAVLLWPKLGARQYWTSLGRSILVIVILWPIFNIGILLDFKNFVDYQKIQAVMSVQANASIWGGLKVWLSMASDLHWGIGWVMVSGFLAYPLILVSGLFRTPYRNLHMALWCVVLTSMVLVLWIVRDRQPEHLWITSFVFMQFLASFGLVEIVRNGSRAARLIVSGALAASFVVSIFALSGLWSQTLARPMSRDLAVILRAGYSDEKILSLPRLDLPQSPNARAIERDRVARLAQKYNVLMPKETKPDPAVSQDKEAIFWLPTPAVMFGLEAATEDDLADLIKPHAWPPQPEEWHLRYWLQQGVTIYVVSDLDYMLTKTPSPLFRQFYGEIAETCLVQETISPRKPLFLEREVTIFRCNPNG